MGQKVQGSSFSSAARDAPELAALQGLGFSCSKATRSKAPEPQQSNAQQSSRAAAKQRAVKLRSQVQQSKAQQSSGAWLRSLLRCRKATRSKAPEPQQSNAQ